METKIPIIRFKRREKLDSNKTNTKFLSKVCFEFTDTHEKILEGKHKKYFLYNYYNLECLPNDVHPCHTKECLAEEKTSDILKGNLAKRWAEEFVKKPELKSFFLN